MEKVMVDESHRIPTYLKYTVIFDCGCSFTNATWESKEQCLAVCPDHEQPQGVVHTHLTCGVRPERAETLKSILKINLCALKNQLSE